MKRRIEQKIDTEPYLTKNGRYFKLSNRISDEDLSEIFVEVFPSNYMNKFINHAAVIEDKKGKYLFIIANTYKDNKRDTHWWSILDIEPRNDIFFLRFFQSRWSKTLYHSR